MNVLTQVNNDGIEEVQAGSTVTFSFLTDNVNQFDITVMTEDREVLFHEVLTGDELEEIGNRIIIEEPSSSIPLPPFIHPAASRFALPYLFVFS